MNRITFSGNLGSDARLINTQEGKAFIAFAVADKGENPIWAECTKSVTGQPAILPYLTKGKRVLVTGRAYAKSFQKENGETVPQLCIFVDEIELS